MSGFRKMTSGPEAAICLASMFKSSLGVRHGLKCIIDGDKELFLRSASLVLQNLDIEHPVGQYLVNTCQSFHKRHGNGVKTLLFLIGTLMKMAVSQRENAIPVCDIVSAMEEGVQQCQKVMEEVKLPLSDVIQSCDQCQGTIQSPGRDSQPTHGEAVVTETQVQDVDQVQDKQRTRNMLINDQGMNEQLPCEVTDFPTGVSSAIPLHTVDMVQLSLKENIANPEEDVDWFFEDDPIIQGQDNVNHMIVQGHIRPGFLQNKTRGSDYVKTLEVANESQGQSDDSDFDDCFDDIPEVHKFDLGKSESLDTGTSALQAGDIWNRPFKNSFANSKTRNVISGLLLQGHTGQESLAGNVEDDFDSCFNVEDDSNDSTAGTSSNEGQPKIRGQQVSGQGVLCPPDRGKNFSGSIPVTQTLEMKLQDILQRTAKEKEKAHTSVYNSSRHFKSVESTVDLHMQGESSTDQKGHSDGVTSPGNHDLLGQSATYQGLKCQGQSNVFHNQAGILQDKKKTLQSESEPRLNKPPCGDAQDKLDTKPLETQQSGSEGLRRKLDIILEKARSQKVSGAMLQSRHFREIGQSMDDIENVQRLEVKGQCIKNVKSCSVGQMLRDKNDVAASVCQVSEVKSQELDVQAQPGQSSEVKRWDTYSTSGQNEEEIGIDKCRQMTSDFVTGDCGVVSEHDCSDRRMVCKCAASGETDRWAGLRGVARSVSHCDEDMMDTLVEAAVSQWRTEGCQDMDQARLTLDLLYCCVTLGPQATRRLVSGVVMTADIANLPLVHQYKGRQLNTIMINGDIKPTYHHIGYKRPLDVQKTMTARDFLQADGRSSWLNDVGDILHKFSITCLLVRGSICDEVKVVCETCGVIAIENVPYKALHVMCTATVTSMATYLSLADKTNVCASVSLDTYTEMMGCQANFVKVTCHNTPVQTCVLSHPSTGGGDLMEQDFWRCANILSSLLSSGHVLPGGGRTEQLCSRALLSSSAAVTMGDAVTTNHYLPHVLQGIAAVLHEYYITVNLNTGQGHTDPPIKGQGHTDHPSIKGQGHKDPSPIKGQGHKDPPPFKGQGHTDPPIKVKSLTDPIKGQGHTDPPIKGQSLEDPIEGQGHTDHPQTKVMEADCIASLRQTLFYQNKRKGQDHKDVLENLNGEDSENNYRIKGGHHLKLPSNSDKTLPSDLDIQATNVVLEMNQLSYFDELQDLEQRENLSVIFDDYKSKMASIQAACDFVATVLMCDSYIVTGVDQVTGPGLRLDTTNFVSGQLVDVIL